MHAGIYHHFYQRRRGSIKVRPPRRGNFFPLSVPLAHARGKYNCILLSNEVYTARVYEV